jgi:glutamine synthetase
MTMNEFSPREVIALCRQREIQAIDLRFTDFRGYQRHFTIPASQLTEDRFQDGFGFDGSSMSGWQAIHESDMLIVPDPQTAFVDPFMPSTLAIIGNIKDPVTHQSYERDPRNIARKAENYMISTGIADRVAMGPEVAFFVFDDVRFDQSSHEAFYHIDSHEGQWNRGKSGAGGYQVRYREGYLPMPPADSLAPLRTEIMLALQEGGVPTEAHHREAATAGQCQVDLDFDSLVRTSDHLMRLKYLVRNVAAGHDKSATFMPKPLWNDNGSGLHLRLALWKDSTPLFAGSGYGGLSETAMFALGGLLRHTASLLAFCCPTTNSYKRLVPGFDAPVNVSYSYRNRSAAVRIPVNSGDDERRSLEFRCPDSASNPYLASSAVLMAMLDGIQNRIEPGRPLDKDLYDLEPQEQHDIPQVPHSLSESLAALERDHDYLLQGDVFTSDVLETWIRHKRTDEVDAIRQRPHPFEFTMYYDC